MRCRKRRQRGHVQYVRRRFRRRFRAAGSAVRLGLAYWPRPRETKARRLDRPMPLLVPAIPGNYNAASKGTALRRKLIAENIGTRLAPSYAQNASCFRREISTVPKKK